MVRGMKGIGACSRWARSSHSAPAKRATAQTTDSTAAATAGGTTTTTIDSSANMQANGATSNPASTKTMTDPEIFAMLTAANQGEIDAGKMAETKATNAAVKAFARQMVADHGKMLADGEALAKKLNITPMPAAVTPSPAPTRRWPPTLTSAPKGADFRHRVRQRRGHGPQNTLDMIKRAEDQAQNADLKNMLKTAEPVIQKHLDQIKDIQGKMK